MTIADLRIVQTAEPFRPFAIRTGAGGCVVVADPERIALSPWGGEVVVFGTKGQIHFLEMDEIAELAVLPDPARPRLDVIPDLFA